MCPGFATSFVQVIIDMKKSLAHNFNVLQCQSKCEIFAIEVSVIFRSVMTQKGDV